MQIDRTQRNGENIFTNLTADVQHLEKRKKKSEKSKLNSEKRKSFCVVCVMQLGQMRNNNII